MSGPAGASIPYRRSRFTTHLPVDRRYTPAHHWLLEESPGIWRVGFTRFALRLLGDVVECEFSVSAGAPVALGQEIGSIEGFKAATAICCAIEGEFLSAGDAVVEDVTFVETDPYEHGWLYRVRGRPDPESVDVHGYIPLLDASIDVLLRSRRLAGDADDLR